jgi:hypothetical protein
MSYDAIEHSGALGQPFFLYAFSDNSGTTRFASLPLDITLDGHVWTASPIAHSEVEQTGNVERSMIEFTFPISDAFATDFLQPTTQITTVTIFRSHHSDIDHELRSYWKGRLVGAKSTKFNVELVAESVFTSLRRPGCRVRVQRSCRHDHYGPVGCTLNRAAWEVAGTVTAINNISLTIPEAASLDSGRLNAGIINWGGRFGFVQSHSGSSITLVSEIPDLEDSFEASGPQAILMAPGCDRSLTGARGCASFSNQLNYGGYLWLPQLNPFTTSLI